MAYSDFTFWDIEKKFGITSKSKIMSFDIKPIEASEWLKRDLQFAETQPADSEKAKSEWIVAPILKELVLKNNNYFKVYSGNVLNVDTKQGLSGECDFILVKDAETMGINYPIIQIVEAKNGEIEKGIPQCAAQMVGAYYFNEQKGVKIEQIYGCVTNGDVWKFMKLEDNVILIDQKKYYLGELEKLLGTFQAIIDYYKEHLK